MLEKYKIGVIGAGYAGLVTGACLAHAGHRVTLADNDAEKVLDLERGEVPIYEPGLRELMAWGAESLSYTTELAPVIRGADVLFVAAGTPPGEGGAASLDNVASVAREIGRVLAGFSRERPLVAVNKSTVPLGSGDYVSMLIREGIAEADGDGAADFRVVSSPEFPRDVPGLEIARRLNSLGGRAAGYAPVSGKGALGPMPELCTVFSLCEALEGAHAAVLVTGREESGELDLRRVAACTQSPALFVDGSNFLGPPEVRKAGLIYEGFGRG